MKNTQQTITVETVVALTKEQDSEIKDIIKKKFGTEKYTSLLNKDLLGGIRIAVNSTQYDASLQGKLAQLRSK